jgi:5'-3' exonuclease
MQRMKPLALDTSEMSVKEMEGWGSDLADLQKSINWWIGDLARAARAKLGDDNYSQVFPPDTSPGLIQRCEAVSRAYPPQDRNPLATWTAHMGAASKPDRLARLAAIVDQGLTTDESRQADKEEKANGRPRWILCVDVSYFLHRFWFSGAGVEAAVGVSDWVQRTVTRLKEKGLTDCACCFDSKVNHRKEFTKEWEDKYKDRPPKDPELVQQLNLVYDLLKGAGFACVGLEGFEADDVMASYAKQFEGRVTLLTQDKDCRQCLSEKCNMLLDVEWLPDETSGDMLPDYKWLSGKQHTEKTGIPPARWIEFQCLMGDSTDGITGAKGIGEKGAADLVKEFGTCENAIADAKAALAGFVPTKSKPKVPARVQALVDFEPKLEVTRKLVALRTDLEIPSTTRI